VGVKVFWSEKHRLHLPRVYLADGTIRPVPEVPARVDAILQALRESPQHEVVEADASRFDPWPAIRAIHRADYLEYLRTIQPVFEKEFSAEGATDVLPDTFFPPGRVPRRPSKPSAQTGYYSFDIAAPISPGTYTGAVEAAACAVAATDAVLAGDRAAYALCRPPGHHAGPAYCGGFCFINNAAVAAQHFLRAGKKRVAVLDIDYHHGNGTQDIFYDRQDVLYVSVHADPNTQYPYFWGYADETGTGDGVGHTINLPLPRGTDEATWLEAVSTGVARVKAFAPEALVISFGADVHEADTVGDFRVSYAGITKAGDQIAALGLPTVIVQEGGYNLKTLGTCVESLLAAFH
jgi:acetoin utilization deacetylase AcuC-like enzyme